MTFQADKLFGERNILKAARYQYSVLCWLSLWLLSFSAQAKLTLLLLCNQIDVEH